MAYIDTQKVKEIRNKIKKQFPEFKFSIVREHYSTVKISIIEGSVDLGETYQQLNPYYLERIENQALRELAQEILKIVRETVEVKYHETGDYGSQPNYYTYIQV